MKNHANEKIKAEQYPKEQVESYTNSMGIDYSKLENISHGIV